jgi:transcriptional regulator with XRE-family HTH domain
MNIIVGENIRKLRKSLGYSQEFVAEYLNISQSAYARIENGKTNSWSYHLMKLCALFRVKLIQIIDSNQEDSFLLENSNEERPFKEVLDSLVWYYEYKLQEKEEVIKLLRTELYDLKN